MSSAAEASLREFLEPYDPTPTDEDIALLADYESGEASPGYTDSDIGQEHVQHVSGWHVTDAGNADWALRRIADAEASRDAALALAGQQIQQVRDWVEREQNKAERTVKFFKSRLESYHLAQIAAAPNPKKPPKTISLPHGELKMTAQQDQYVHDALTVELCKLIGLPVRVTEEPKWDEIKARLAKGEKQPDGSFAAVDTETGVVLTDVKIVPQPDKFTAKPKGVGK